MKTKVSERKGKKVFITGMMTKSQWKQEKNGLYKGDKDQRLVETTKKWSS